MHKRPICLAKLRTVPRQCSWVDQRLVRERSIDRLSPQACTLSLFVLTVADAQGLSDYGEASLCQRLSMTPNARHLARQALIKLGLLAYQHPLYQVLDLAPIRTPTSASSLATDDSPVDIKAVFERIWEGLA